MRLRKLTGSDWSAIGVAISVVGALFAWYGTRVSGQENKQRGEEHVGLTRKALVATEELEVKSSELAESSAQLAAKSDQLAAKSEEIANLNRKIAETSDRFAAYVLGTGSFIYLHTQNVGLGSVKTLVQHVGKNPVRDTEILVFDISDKIPKLIRGELDRFVGEVGEDHKLRVAASYPGLPIRLTTNPFAVKEDRESVAYFVYIGGANGLLRQVIQFVKVGEVWTQAYKVQRVVGDGKYSPIGEYFDRDFPTQGNVFLKHDASYPDLTPQL